MQFSNSFLFELIYYSKSLKFDIKNIEMAIVANSLLKKCNYIPKNALKN